MSTVIALEATMIGVLSVLFGAVWLRGREAGMATLCLGFAFVALWYVLSEGVPYTPSGLVEPSERSAGVLIALGVMVLTFGVVQYLGLPSGRMRLLVIGCWVPSLLLIVAVAATPGVPHRVFHHGVLFSYVGTAVLAFRRAREEPGDGHLLLALALLTLPLTPVLMSALDIPPQLLKYVAGASVCAFGMMLLTVSLLRRQRALTVEVGRRAAAEEGLRESNYRLEARVAERTADLRELINGLESFSRSVSHDLRGPLGGMSTLATMAADAMAQGDPSLARKALPLIASQCNDSIRLVSTMLELARLSDMVVQREEVDLAALARAAFDEVMLAASAGTRRPALDLGPLPRVMADPRLLRPVFVNLLGNALKFSQRAEHPRIDLRAELRGKDLHLCVHDNGVGFSPDVAARIFEPYFRAHGGTFAGHGLGLSIVRRAVEAMGGRAWAQAPPEGGASLWFSLPDAAVASGAARPVAA